MVQKELRGGVAGIQWRERGECWLPMRPRASSLNLMLSLSSPSSPGVMALYNVNDTFVKAPVIYYRRQQPPLLQHQAVALQWGKWRLMADPPHRGCCLAENFIVWLWPFRICQFMVMAILDGAYIFNIYNNNNDSKAQVQKV